MFSAEDVWAGAGGRSGLPTARGEGEAIKAGGPGRQRVGGAAALTVQSGWKTRSGVRLETEDTSLEGGWEVMQSFGPCGFGH